MPQMQRLKHFLEDNDIAPSTFYRMQRDGRAPQTVKDGRKTYVTREAAEVWRRSLEAAQGAAA